MDESMYEQKIEWVNDGMHASAKLWMPMVMLPQVSMRRVGG